MAAAILSDPSKPGGWSLSRGYPAVALLFAELGRDDSRWRDIAHAMLSQAVAEIPVQVDMSLYTGLASIAFAARANAVEDGDYTSVLGQLDSRLSQAAGSLCAAELRTLRTTGLATVQSYDVISGLTGLGRYLLLTRSHQESVSEILRYLVAVTERQRADVPGWWVDSRPFAEMSQEAVEAYAWGHGNFGLAHGISGPLVLLSLAWRMGVIVPGQQAAIERVVDWLLRWQFVDGYGVCWPTVVSLEQHEGRETVPPRYVGSWCYGTPGLARAIQIAGLALNRPDWRQVADRAMLSALERPVEHLNLRSAAICHGWAGLLQTAVRIAADGSEAGERVADLAAERTLALFESEAAFGFRFPTGRSPASHDGPGLLEGAAGTALSLHGYATGRLPRFEWDAALLLA
ncbi:lanthionine synthetase C family protein [Nonomuraea sp. KM90]